MQDIERSQSFQLYADELPILLGPRQALNAEAVQHLSYRQEIRNKHI